MSGGLANACRGTSTVLCEKRKKMVRTGQSKICPLRGVIKVSRPHCVAKRKPMVWETYIKASLPLRRE